MRLSIRSRSVVATVAAMLYMLLLGTYVVNRPSYDWDMIAYVAVALEMTGTSHELLHDKAYRIVQQSVPAAAHDSLTGHVTPESVAATSSTTTLADPEFRQAVATDSRQFLAQLPFFAVKPLYPALMAVPYTLGLNMIKGGLLVSATAYFGIGMLFFVWFRQWMPPFIALGTMALLIINPFLVTQARTIGPDILSIFALLLGVYMVMRNRPVTGILILIAAISIRPENILYVMVFLLYVVAIHQIRPVFAIPFVVGAIYSYLVITTMAGNYGWQTLFYYSFVNKAAALGDARPHLTLMDYASFYLGRLDRILMGQGEAPIFALIGFGGLVLKYGSRMHHDKYVHLILLTGVIAAARMIVLPTEAFRALLPCYMLVTIAFIQACAFCKLTATGRLSQACEVKMTRASEKPVLL